MAKGRQYKNDQAGEEIRRLWGDVEVVDAKKPLRVFIMQEDKDKATKKDPGCCIFAQACKRTFGATKVLFFRTVAYVELPDKNGKRHVERYVMPPEMRALVAAFDRGEGTIPEAGFELRVPKPSRRFEAQRLRDRERQREKRVKGEVLHGTAERKGKQGLGRYQDESITIDLSVRNGSGSVQFIPKKVKSKAE